MKPKTYTEKQVSDWNAKHPVGSECFVTRDNGDKHKTKTMSEAWLLPWGGALVLLDSTTVRLSGGYSIDRVSFDGGAR